MRKFYFTLLLLFVIGKLAAQYSLTVPIYPQDFNGLGITSSTGVTGGSLNVVSPTLNGWYFLETGSNLNLNITASTGSSGTGDTYNFGTTSAVDRTLGGLQSGNLNPTIGFYVTNNTGSVITSLTISYTGEQWRLGTIGRLDKLDFQYSQNATALNNGNWIDADVLDFIAPVTSGLTGSLNGNTVGNNSAITNIITGLYIPNASNFFIRWSDFDATGAEDGLGIDDLTLTAGVAIPSTDYFRTAGTGNWTDILTWESSTDNTTWGPATVIPTASAKTISIKAGHTVNYAAFLPVNEVVIESGGTLDFTNGNLIVDDDAIGDEIDIQSGGFFILSSNAPSFSGTAPTVNVQGNGILRVSASGLTLTAGGGVHAANYVYRHQSVLEHTLTTAFGTVGVTYFPNVGPSVIPVFRITQTIGVNVGSNNLTTINGIFEANGNVTFNASGLKTFRNGIKGSGNVNATATSGKFIINGLTAEIGGTGTLTTPTTGLEIGPSTSATLTSNKIVTGDIALLGNSYVQLGTNNLTVSGVITGGSATSFIRTNGSGALTLKSIAPAAFKIFPLGSSTYNPVRITNDVLNAATDFTVRVNDNIVPAIAFPTYGINRTWNIHATALTPNVDVDFQYATADANAGASAQPTPMEILENISNVWNIMTGNANILPGGADPAWNINTATTIAINSFATPYALGINGTQILAIDCIISCNARKNNNNGIVTFNINSCAQVNSFEVQRSTAGGNYQTIATLPPDLQLTVFNYTDLNIPKGTNLYRIKVNRASGLVKYSNTVALINEVKGLLITSVFPNPATEKMIINISAAKHGPVTFDVYNLAGVPVKKWTSYVMAGNNAIALHVEDLAAGVYTVQAIGQEVSSRFQIIKQ